MQCFAALTQVKGGNPGFRLQTDRLFQIGFCCIQVTLIQIRLPELKNNFKSILPCGLCLLIPLQRIFRLIEHAMHISGIVQGHDLPGIDPCGLPESLESLFQFSLHPVTNTQTVEGIDVSRIQFQCCFQFPDGTRYVSLLVQFVPADIQTDGIKQDSAVGTEKRCMHQRLPGIVEYIRSPEINCWIGSDTDGNRTIGKPINPVLDIFRQLQGIGIVLSGETTPQRICLYGPPGAIFYPAQIINQAADFQDAERIVAVA